MDEDEDFTASWAAQLRELHEAAGRPTAVTIARHAAGHTPPFKVKVTPQRWSDWRKGHYVPSNLEVAMFLIRFLRQLAQQKTPDFLPPSDRWWQEIWRRARTQRANPGGRPSTKYPVAVALGERQSKGEATAVTILRSYANEYSTVKIILFPMRMSPIARNINAIFQLAGWETNFNETPQEGYVHLYFEGIEVSGCNSHLITSVAEAFRQTEIPAMRINHLPNEINLDNAKYYYVEHAVRITIGHV